MLGLITLIYACGNLDRAVISFILEPIRHEFRLTDAQLGVVAGLAFSLGYAITALPIGRLADRVNRRFLILFCLVSWSALTALCGLAANYLQLVLARIGVGAAEAYGSVNLSLISDLFTARRRATAMAIYSLGAPAGSMLAAIVAGPIAIAYGWRAAVFVAAAPGALLAVLLLLFGREPPREAAPATARSADGQAPGFGETLRFILGQRSLLNMIGGLTLVAFTLSGLNSFAVSFFIRYHGMPQSSVAAVFGPAAIGAALVMLGAGALADRLGRRDPRFRLWLIAGVQVLAFLLLTIAYSQPHILALGAFVAAFVLGQVWAGPGYATAQALTPARMRGTSAAIMFMLSNLIGAGAGPVVVGALSDRLTSDVGSDGLRWAMLVVNLVNLWAAVHFFLASRTLKEELGRVGQVAHDQA
jgi:MFS family permease